MPKLKSPKSGRVGTFSEGQARIRRARGWTDVDPNPTKATSKKATDDHSDS